MAVFFTADEHYDHRNIIQYCNRPFADVYEMREALIANHNQKVSKADLVYHLGDMFWRTLSHKDCLDIRHRLNGQHYYILGNHEEPMEKYDHLQRQFVWIRSLTNIYPQNGLKIVLCHYAMRVWDGSHRGSWQLYGHSHGELPEQGLSFDVGVDANGYAPVSLDEVAEKMRLKGANG